MSLLIRILTFVLFASLALPAVAAERVLLAPAGTAERAKTATRAFSALLKTANDQGTVKVIVGLRVPFAAEGTLRAAEASEQRADIARAGSSFRNRMDIAIRRNPAAFRAFTTVPFAAVEVTADELRKLAADPEVISITPNAAYKPLLDISNPMIRATEAWSAGFSGAGQTVAIIDTGVDKTHPFLAGKVVAEGCFSIDKWCPGGVTSSTAPGSGMPCPGDCSHGTHVAGIAAGRGTGFSGVARDASIIAIQGFSPTPAGRPVIYLSDATAALEYIYSLRNTFSIASVNMSFGGYSQTPDDCDRENPAMVAAMVNLRSAGIASIAASGNDYNPENIGSPACMSPAISVGAVATKDWGYCQDKPEYGPTARDKVACFSSSGPKLSLLAPGLKITSSVPGGAFSAYSGTSMAAPHVAGAWAVLKQKKPAATVEDMLDLLQQTGVPVTDYRNGRLHKRIDVKAALDVLGGNFLLSYSRTGKGTGTVNIAAPGGSRDCDKSCTDTYAPGTVLTLTPTPTGGSSFAGWSGACSGTASCTLTMSQARSVTANFKPAQMTLTFQRSGDGEGSVSFLPEGGEASTCTDSCVRTYDVGTEVKVEPKPAAGSVFGTFDGPCYSWSDCSFTMSESKTLTASFHKSTGTEIPLTYEKAGPGQGSVVFSPAGSQYRCDANCVNIFQPGAAVYLQPIAGIGSRFAGWSGACDSEYFCTIVMDDAKKVTALFKLPPVVLSYKAAGSGLGKVVFSPKGSRPSCNKSCDNEFDADSTVTLTATAFPGSAFAGWSGACTGNGDCTVTMDSAKQVVANFDFVSVVNLPLTLQRSGNGHGAVEIGQSPNFITCVADCTNTYRPGTELTLTPKPAAGTTFKGWSGACTGTGPCTVTMETALTAVATFEATGTPRLPLIFSSNGGGFSISPDGGAPLCFGPCVNAYLPGTRVEVKLNSFGIDTVFMGWTGACRGKGRCIVTMRKATTVGAVFKTVPMVDLTVTKAGYGEGMVDGCVDTCVRKVQLGQKALVMAQEFEGSVFVGWSGDCRGKRKTCTLTMKGPRNVTATFKFIGSQSAAAARPTDGSTGPAASSPASSRPR